MASKNIFHSTIQLQLQRNITISMKSYKKLQKLQKLRPKHIKLYITMKYLHKSKYFDIIDNISTKNRKFCSDIYVSIDDVHESLATFRE